MKKVKNKAPTPIISYSTLFCVKTKMSLHVKIIHG